MEKIAEHLTLKTNLGLDKFLHKLQTLTNIDIHERDFENECEWFYGYDCDNIEINVSRIYKKNTLNEWDKTVPKGYNYGISLRSSRTNFEYDEKIYTEKFVLEYLIPKYINLLFEVSKSNVIYHRGNYYSKYIENNEIKELNENK